MMGGQNTSQMDSSKHGMSKSELVDDGNHSQSTGRENQDLKDNFFKVKNVFEILIREGSYLIDDKALQQCEGKSQKEQFLIQIDSIRKSLSIDSMQDVQLLVTTFYEFGEKKKKRLEEEEKKRLAEREEMELNNMPQLKDPKNDKDKKDAKNKDGKNAAPEPLPIENEEEEKDPTKPDLDLDDVVECLEEFHNEREQQLANQDAFVNPTAKKKSNFQTEE